MSMMRIVACCLILALPACVGGAPLSSAGIPAAPQADPRATELERASLEMVNSERRVAGLSPMRIDPLLSHIADGHARDMQARGYYSHVSPSGVGVQQRHDKAGGAEWRLVAENIARCSRCRDAPGSEDVAAYHERWMGSAGHRANILAPGLDSFGFAAAHGEDGFYLVQNFSGPGMPGGLQPGDSLQPLSPEAQAGAALERVNAARARAGVRPLSASPALTQAILQVMPRPGAADFDVRSTGEVQRALSERDRARWSGIGTVYGACGACGREPVGADIRFFISEWLERPAFRSLLLDPAAEQLGFAIAANGEGRKIALVAVGRGG